MANWVRKDAPVYCDLCKQVQGEDAKVLAWYDAKTIHGPWANLCEKHFQSDTTGRLGTGYGQSFVYSKEVDVHAETS